MTMADYRGRCKLFALWWVNLGLEFRLYHRIRFITIFKLVSDQIEVVVLWLRVLALWAIMITIDLDCALVELFVCEGVSCIRKQHNVLLLAHVISTNSWLPQLMQCRLDVTQSTFLVSTAETDLAGRALEGVSRGIATLTLKKLSLAFLVARRWLSDISWWLALLQGRWHIARYDLLGEEVCRNYLWCWLWEHHLRLLASVHATIYHTHCVLLSEITDKVKLFLVIFSIESASR